MPAADDWWDEAERLTRELERARSAYNLYSTYLAAKEETDALANAVRRGEWVKPKDEIDNGRIDLKQAWIDLVRELGIDGAQRMADRWAEEMMDDEPEQCDECESTGYNCSLHMSWAEAEEAADRLPDDLPDATVDRG